MSDATKPASPAAEGGARDVERLFAGEFGVAYTDRNTAVDPRKPAFFAELMARHGVGRVLECGCNLGLNLGDAIAAGVDVWGIDIQRKAVETAWSTLRGGNFVVGSILELPFRDAWFDLAFTCGVLIHVPPAGLGSVMDEMVRVSRRYVMSAEYHDDQREVVVPWRGQSAALWRRNYKQIWLERHPELSLVAEGYKSPEEGFDRITWHLFEKRP